VLYRDSGLVQARNDSGLGHSIGVTRLCDPTSRNFCKPGQSLARFSEQLLHLKIFVDYHLCTQLLFVKLKPPKERAPRGNHVAEFGIW
jgi:hypothetical protein